MYFQVILGVPECGKILCFIIKHIRVVKQLQTHLVLQIVIDTDVGPTRPGPVCITRRHVISPSAVQLSTRGGPGPAAAGNVPVNVFLTHSS